MKLDIKIMGVEKRLPLIEETLKRTGLPHECVVLDDRGYGGANDAWYNAKRAWLAPLPLGTTHRLVLQDDALVCDGFVEIVNKIIAQFPDAMWMLNGNTWIEPEMRKTRSPYIKIRGGKTTGEAIILPVEHIRPMIEWSDDMFGETYKHDDSRIGWYCAYHSVPVMSTIPSLVDHLPVETCIKHHNRKDRVSHTWVGVDIGEQDWGTPYYNTSPLLMSYTWLPKDDPHWPRVRKMEKIARMRARMES